MDQAWGQTGRTDNNGVSQTLTVLHASETEAIRGVLGQISAPFIDEEAFLPKR